MSTIRMSWGRFEGVVKTEWRDPTRKMVLLDDFAYIDPSDVRWDAPKDSVIDGASIPSAFWSIIGSPYTGEYRQAAVVHDVACDAGRVRRPWKQVHRMFYHAMRCGGVGEKHALIMYGAVYFFGPKWSEGSKGLSAFLHKGPAPTSEHVDALTRFVEEQQLRTVEAIEQWQPPDVERRRTPIA